MVEETEEYKELQSIADELLPIIKKGDCIAWIGSGPSIGLYPDWTDLIIKLCEVCEIPESSPTKETKSDELILIADKCKTAKEERYQAKLAQEFGGPVSSTPSTYHLVLNMPFKGYITTNFDPALSFSANSKWPNMVNINPYPFLNNEILGKTEKTPVFYLHGLARHGDTPRGDNLVLSKSEFDEAYNGGNAYVFLHQLLQFNKIIFMGCGLTENEIAQVFSRVRDLYLKIQPNFERIEEPTRIILLPCLYSKKDRKRDEDEENEKNKFYENMGIRVIRYPNEEEDFLNLDRILEKVCRGIGKPAYAGLHYGIEEVLEDDSFVL